ncbi:MAG: hypothetical protein PHD04_03370, partial [Candidatus Pacebacteria bacterium]|nr:hypothetical protein [Candidatus Paceibacterota bacterium]
DMPTLNGFIERLKVIRKLLEVNNFDVITQNDNKELQHRKRSRVRFTQLMKNKEDTEKMTKLFYEHKDDELSKLYDDIGIIYDRNAFSKALYYKRAKFNIK